MRFNKNVTRITSNGIKLLKADLNTNIRSHLYYSRQDYFSFNQYIHK